MAANVCWGAARRAVLGVAGHALRGTLPGVQLSPSNHGHTLNTAQERIKRFADRHLQSIPLYKVPTSGVLWKISQLPAYFFSTQAESEDQNLTAAAKSTDTFDTVSRYKEKPWEYLTSEEYIERYGERPVWADYRRNHKGGIPPQKTRKTCIRGVKICGNPCPICRDQKLGLNYQNVKLLEQFISPYTGEILDPTRTGVCMKQHKKLTTVIGQARGFGLLGCRVPFVEFHEEDYTNTHGAVTKTPPAPALQTGTVWYPWYEWQQPPEREVALIRKIYRRYLKEKPQTNTKDNAVEGVN